MCTLPTDITTCAGASTDWFISYSKNSIWIRSLGSCFCFAEGSRTGSKPCIGTLAVSCFCINVWNKVGINGRGRKNKRAN